MNNLERVLRAIHNALCAVRTTVFERGGFDNSHFYWAAYGRAQGLIEGARAGGLITHEAEVALGDLVSNASSNAGKPFPDPRNVGPVMPILVRVHRNAQLGKPQAPVAANECDKQVSEVGAPRQLRLLCLLVKSSNVPARYLPVHTMRPMPPRVCGADSRHQNGQGQWRMGRPALELVNNTGLHLREARAVAPAPEVLARYIGHRKAYPAHPYSGAVSVGGLTHV